jgi:hypothetical protein
MGTLVTAMFKVDGLKRHYLFVEDKAQQAHQSFIIGYPADLRGQAVGEEQLVIVCWMKPAF